MTKEISSNQTYGINSGCMCVIDCFNSFLSLSLSLALASKLPIVILLE